MKNNKYKLIFTFCVIIISQIIILYFYNENILNNYMSSKFEKDKKYIENISKEFEFNSKRYNTILQDSSIPKLLSEFKENSSRTEIEEDFLYLYNQLNFKTEHKPHIKIFSKDNVLVASSDFEKNRYKRRQCIINFNIESEFDKIKEKSIAPNKRNSFSKIFLFKVKFNKSNVGIVEISYDSESYQNLFFKRLDKGFDILLKNEDQNTTYFSYLKNKEYISISPKDIYNMESIKEAVMASIDIKVLNNGDNFYKFIKINNSVQFVSFIKINESNNSGYFVVYSDSLFLKGFNDGLYFQIIMSIILIIILAILFKSIYKAHEQILNIATHDTLTGLHNREYFDSKLKEMDKREISVLMIDIDFFKKINDTYGHDIGDKALKRFANLITPLISENEIFIRWGGEEFYIVTNKKNKDLEIFAEEIRKNIEFNSEYEDIPKFTCTIGVSNINETSGDLKKLFILTDKKLYKGKELGRNRIQLTLGD